MAEGAGVLSVPFITVEISEEENIIMSERVMKLIERHNMKVSEGFAMGTEIFKNFMLRNVETWVDPSAEIIVADGGKFSMSKGRLVIHEGAKLEIGGNFSIWNDNDIEIYKDAVLVLGSGYMNTGSIIRCRKHIEIGYAVAISHRCWIADSDLHNICDAVGNIMNPDQDVKIGNKVWIGCGASVLKGVTIGDGSVVGASSVVTHDVPSKCAVAGNPARVVHENIAWD